MQPEIRIQEQTTDLEARWQQDARWTGIERTYTAAEVVRLRGSVVPEQHARAPRRASGCGSSCTRTSRCARSAP